MGATYMLATPNIVSSPIAPAIPFITPTNGGADITSTESTTDSDSDSDSDSNEAPLSIMLAGVHTAATSALTSSPYPPLIFPIVARMVGPLCYCFNSTMPPRSKDVQAWLDDQPWHVDKKVATGATAATNARDRRCMDGCPGCLIAASRFACETLLSLESNIKQRLEMVDTVFLPPLRKYGKAEDERLASGNRTGAGARADDEGYDILHRLLDACGQVLEGRKQMACVVAARLAHDITELLRITAKEDEDIDGEMAVGKPVSVSGELRGLLARLNSSEVLSGAVIEAQKRRVRRLMEDTQRAKFRVRDAPTA